MVHFFERNFIAGNTTTCAGQTRKPRSIRGMCQSSATRILNIQGEIKDIVYKAKKKKNLDYLVIWHSQPNLTYSQFSFFPTK